MIKKFRKNLKNCLKLKTLQLTWHIYHIYYQRRREKELPNEQQPSRFIQQTRKNKRAGESGKLKMGRKFRDSARRKI
jgi:hypothetical protein